MPDPTGASWVSDNSPAPCRQFALGDRSALTVFWYTRWRNEEDVPEGEGKLICRSTGFGGIMDKLEDRFDGQQ